MLARPIDTSVYRASVDSGCITTTSGLKFNLRRPTASSIKLTDIAHALSHLCRYTGHVPVYYTVAEHSVLVSMMVEPKLARWALLHDASEAYLGDVSAPLKAMLPDYRAIEHNVEQSIWAKFGLYGPLPAEIKAADVAMYYRERELLWGRVTPRTWGPDEAYARFLGRASELGIGALD